MYVEITFLLNKLLNKKDIIYMISK